MKKTTYILFFFIQTISYPQTWSGTFPDEWDTSLTNDGYRAMNHSFYNIDSNRTYFFWVGNNMASYVGAIDHDNDSIFEAYKLCDNDIEDGHFYPNGIVLHTGNIMTVSGYDQQMEVCISDSPHDISSFTCSDPGIRYFDYPKIFQSKLGRIFIFFSQSFRDAIDCDCSGHPKDEESYIYSDDNGATWVKRTSTRGQYMSDRWDETDWMNEMYIGPYVLDTSGGEEKLWAVYTLSGGAIHDQYHADLYCFYVKFDSASVGKPVKLYAPDGTDLDTLIDQTEMETYCMVLDTQGTGKSYPPYVNTVAINDSGYPLVNGLYYYNGTSHFWDSINQYGTRNNTVFMDHKYHHFNTSTIDTSYNGVSYSSVSSYNLTNVPTGTNTVRVATTQISHPNARLWVGRWGTASPDGGQGYCGKEMDSTSFRLDVEANCPNIRTSDTAKIDCYIRDSLGGKVTWDQKQVTFSLSGDGQLLGNTTQTTVDGAATVYYLAPATDGNATITVSSSGLINDEVEMYPSITGLETSFYFSQESQQQESLPKKIGNYRIGNYFLK